jgi:hypothetical protein
MQRVLGRAEKEKKSAQFFAPSSPIDPNDCLESVTYFRSEDENKAKHLSQNTSLLGRNTPIIRRNTRIFMCFRQVLSGQNATQVNVRQVPRLLPVSSPR